MRQPGAAPTPFGALVSMPHLGFTTSFSVGLGDEIGIGVAMGLVQLQLPKIYIWAFPKIWENPPNHPF